MFRFNVVNCCQSRIHAASGLAGTETWLSQTYSQNGNRLAAYGDITPIEGRGNYRVDDWAMIIIALPLPAQTMPNPIRFVPNKIPSAARETAVIWFHGK